MDKRGKPGLSEVRLAVDDDSFDDLVETLRAVLTIPELPGFAGCKPCRSGLDRIIIEDPAWRALRAEQFG
jgi:hypothetical protein